MGSETTRSKDAWAPSPEAPRSDLSLIEQGQIIRPTYDLKPHRSSLPNVLYILSFSPPVPNLIRHPQAFFGNPIVLYCIGTVFALVAGVGLPAFDIVTGWWTNGVQSDAISPASIIRRGSDAGWIMTVVGVVYLISFTIFLTCFTTAGVKLSGAVREKYLAAIMVQDQAFFDRIGAGEVVTRSSKDIDSIRIGLGERVGYLFWTLSAIVCAFVSAFAHVPKLAGVLFALIPTTMVMFAILGAWSEKTQEERSPLDGATSSFIEQMLSSVRVVQSFDMGKHLLIKLEYTMLKPLRKMSTKVAASKALEQAAGYGVAFLVYSMCFWYGGISVQNGTTVGDVMTTFYNYVNLFFAFATVVPHLIAYTTAQNNLANLRLQIERMPPIDVRDHSGLQLEHYEPSFELENVTFAYPARPAHKALDNVSVTMPAGSFTAFAGPSGSGKSTAASLLLRLYDPKVAEAAVDAKILEAIEEAEKKALKGKGKKERREIKEKGRKAKEDEEKNEVEGCGVVRFAGHDLRDFNVTWLRSQVAVVLQNPQLVSGTVFDNVVIGLTGTELEYRSDEMGPKADERRKIIDARVQRALEMAQAWDFVQELPMGLETVVFGGRTGVLSGGQVQRVALARALVRQPKCLLLDEATSAVSADAELKIQEALIEEQKRTGMTLIVIAHRLSTIVAADKIVVMKDGRPVASGTYDTLVDPSFPDPTFRNMANASSKRHAASAPLSETSSFTVDQPVPAEKSAAAAEMQKSLPPAMTQTSQAFAHVKYLLTIAVLLGLAAGVAFVMAGWLHGRAVSALGNPDLPLMRRQVNRWALWFLVLAIATFMVMLIHVFGLESSGENIVSEFRRESARALIRQDIPFFERESGGTGSLTAAAAAHPSKVGAVIGVVLSQFVTSSSNLIATLIMAFVLTWRLAVMTVPALFVTCILGLLNLKWLQIFEANITKEDEKQSNFVADAVNTAQLNAALTRESEVLRQYNVRFTKRVLDRRYLVAASFALGGTQAMVQFFGGLLFWWGAKQKAEGNVSVANLWTVLESVVVAIFIAAKILTYTSDVARMRNSLQTMQEWLDRIPEGYTKMEGGVSEDKTPGFKLQGVQLRYPSRPDVLALRGVDVHLEPGRSYAFCGTSGAGKSSILALLQRFYEPSAGSISLDGVDIRAMETSDLRAQMGYVSQEPILFEGTIRWNLLAGALDPDAVTQDELEFACEQACILDFIRTLPDGFDTELGMKGGRLSGGQRQRLCIARALLRKPRILLLDEATSALDGQSEAHVQRALDNASKGRLTITIGHRLSAIKGADVIFVMEQGAIVETGSHEELVERGGRYFELIQARL